MCRFMLDFMLKLRPHSGHLNGCSPVCTRLWRCRSIRDAHIFPHTVHMCTRVMSEGSTKVSVTGNKKTPNP